MADNQATAVRAETVQFSNRREARLVKAASSDKIDDLLTALALPPAKTLYLVIGGADGLAEELKPRLEQVIHGAIIPAAIRAQAVVLDGGTQSGVMELLGAAAAKSKAQFALVGVAPACCVSYPGSNEVASPDRVPLDQNHTHFLLAPGNSWGSETGLLFDAADVIARDKTVLAILFNGGDVAKAEALEIVRRGWSVLVLQGTGRLADVVIASEKQSAAETADPDIAEIRAKGRISTVSIDNELSEISRVIQGRPRVDETLMLAWQAFHRYDASANDHQKRFRRGQMWVLSLGVIATLLAITHPPFVRGHVPEEIWQGAVVLAPISVSILIAWVNRFRPGNKWVLLRASTEAVKREIFKYRTRTGSYSEVQCQTVHREVKLVGEIGAISDRLQQSEVNRAAFPTILEKRDEELGILTPGDYIRDRVQDQVAYLERKTKSLNFRLHVLQWSILLLGGAGTFLAAIRYNRWIALTIAMATAITTKLETDQTETSLVQYNQSLAGLRSVLAWWSALTAWEKDCQTNIDLLVQHTEQVLDTGLAGWVQNMQAALEKLRKEQTEREAAHQETSRSS